MRVASSEDTAIPRRSLSSSRPHDLDRRRKAGGDEQVGALAVHHAPQQILHQPDCLPCGAVARVDRWPVPRISRALDYLLDFGILEFSVITELVLKVLTERRAYLED